MRALFPRLLEAERQSGSVLRAFRALHATPSPQGAFVSLPGGTGELIDALVATMPGVVRTQARVTELRRAESLILETSAGRLEARAVILAVPAYVAGSLLRAFDTALAACCDAVPYASTATVVFGVDHIVSGVALNIIGAGLAKYLAARFFAEMEGGGPTQSPPLPELPSVSLPGVSDALGDLEQQDIFFVSDLAGIIRGFVTNVSVLTILAVLLFIVNLAFIVGP